MILMWMGSCVSTDNNVAYGLLCIKLSLMVDCVLFPAKLPLERMGAVHREMIETIQKVIDRKKQIQHILGVSNTINKVY